MSEEEIIDKYIKEINNLVIAYNNLAEEHLPTKMIGEKIDIFTAMLDLYNKQQKEIEKYKRYFKLAISDLQSEGYVQMPYKNIEKYYSKREDIV